LWRASLELVGTLESGAANACPVYEGAPLPQRGSLLSEVANIPFSRALCVGTYAASLASVDFSTGAKSDMASRTNEASFDPKAFLAKVGEGKTILEYRRGQIVFNQGDLADTIFYIQKGRVEVVVTSDTGGISLG